MTMRVTSPRLQLSLLTSAIVLIVGIVVLCNSQSEGPQLAAANANPRPERSQRLVACLRTRYGQATGMNLHSTSVTDDMTSYHAFEEINPETTAAIIEVGFLNLDRQILTQNPDLIAKGITDGILCFVNNEDISP